MSIQPVFVNQRTVAAPPVDPQPTPNNTKERGAVSTKPAVIDFMLDLLGYTHETPLWKRRLMEPSFGSGGFIIAAAQRLLSSWEHGESAGDDSVLDETIRAVELDRNTFNATRQRLQTMLIGRGVPELSAARIVKKWLLCDDFLTCTIDGVFDYVVGNPPYVRQELIPDSQVALYKSMYSTMVGRADLYVPFFERGLSLLNPAGRLCFICADAWTRNDYGRVLRETITSQYGLAVYVDMYGLDAFESPVGAYPSITVISHAKTVSVRTAVATSTDENHLSHLVCQLTSSMQAPAQEQQLAPSSAPWLLRSHDQQSVIRNLESHFMPLEDVGCRVGIGVATGADKVFLGEYETLDVENSRKLPLAVNRDIRDGQLFWGGMGVVNPWTDGRPLVNLTEYPRLAAYLEPHRAILSRRHTAKTNPDTHWYKTIDRIKASLTWQPKLLIPDIRGNGDAITYDAGTVYPHHNLYFITSTTWDLQALQALLRSGMARLFVDAYAVRIGGGYLRFQAQYLRRIRLPRWDTLAPDLRNHLTQAGRAGTKVDSTVVERAYDARPGSMSFIKRWGEQ